MLHSICNLFLYLGLYRMIRTMFGTAYVGYQKGGYNCRIQETKTVFYWIGIRLLVRSKTLITYTLQIREYFHVYTKTSYLLLCRPLRHRSWISQIQDCLLCRF